MREDIGKHLEFIQNNIVRMANTSFLLKGWSVTLAAALFALAAKDMNSLFAVVALFPALVFWALDAYYLRQERLFRRLYDDVANPPAERSAPIPSFSMDTAYCRDQVPTWSRTLLAPSVALLHGVVVAAVLLAVCLLLTI